MHHFATRQCRPCGKWGGIGKGVGVAKADHRLFIAKQMIKHRAQNHRIACPGPQRRGVESACRQEPGQPVVVCHDPGQGLERDDMGGILLQLQVADGLKPQVWATK
jgi:hypothetical protein